ncbi:MAG TPA: hypothetical protein VFJ51_14610, partial [Nitrososphaeraceae archaeon]|nr:hypothetical protein [Nitrososphaeraceae archaeon]
PADAHPIIMTSHSSNERGMMETSLKSHVNLHNNLELENMARIVLAFYFCACSFSSALCFSL